MSHAQVSTLDDNKLKSEADHYFVEEDYRAAFPYCLELYKRIPQSPLVNFYLGVCYLHVSPDRRQQISKEKAIPHLEFSYKTLPIMDVTYYLARAYHLSGNFNKAISFYKSYIDSLEFSAPVFLEPLLTAKDEVAVLEHQIEMCRNGIELMKDTTSLITFENPGEAINTNFPEYAPAISADNEVLIFTSRRPTDRYKRTDEYDLPYEDIYITYKKENRWLPAVPISENINTKRHDASVGLSADAQSLFIYYNGDIYLSSLEGASWSRPKRLKDPINTPAWETHISITSSQNSVYFVSDRKGGVGGRDIYMARKNSSGEWGEVKNLGPVINTPWDEEAPFIHPDERHLYFASTGHNSMGGFDIFYSTLDNGVWSKPKNLGYPINTPDDDIFFTVSSNGKYGYISTIRDDGYGDKDVYAARMPDTGEVPLTVVRGIIRSYDNQPISARFSVTDKKSQELIGIYHANSATGKYLLVFPPGRDYNVVVEADGYVPHSENVKIPSQHRFYDLFQEIQLAGITKKSPGKPDSLVGQRVFVRNAFFDIDSALKIADPALHRAEVKELAYSAFISEYEQAPDKTTVLARLEPVQEARDYLADYQPEIEIHMVYPVDTSKLEMVVAGYDTLYATSEETPTMAKLPLLEPGLVIPPVHYTSRAEADTSRFRPEQYLALKGMDTLFEKLPPPQPQKLEHVITLDEVKVKVEAIEKITALAKQEEEKKRKEEETKLNEEGRKLTEKEEKLKDEEKKLKEKTTVVTGAATIPSSVLGKDIVLKNILFDINNATLRSESYAELDKAAEILRKYVAAAVEVSGHTDSTGSEQFNKTLSERRARSVTRYLAGKGIHASRLHPLGFGEEKPVASNETEEGRKMNRRVEMKLMKMPGNEISASGAQAITVPGDKFLTESEAPPGSGKISVTSAVICKEVSNLQPVESGNAFPAGTTQLCCFTVIQNGAGTGTKVNHKWYHGDQLAAAVELDVKHQKWRTYSRKNIPAGWTGNWRVDVANAEGEIIKSVSFTIE